MNLKNKQSANRQNNRKGSVLVFTMFIMVITLIAGMSIMTVSTTERRSTLASGKSVNAFQIAESGLEVALMVVKTQLDTNLIDNVEGDCSDGKVTKTINEGEYLIEFYADTSGNDLISICNTRITSVKKVKSVGEYRGASRAVSFVVDPVL